MKNFMLIASMLMASLCTSAQDIVLPAPDFNENTTTVIEALRTRHSVRSFDSTPLTNQQLSNLCWAAFGMSRDANHRTAPTAMNRQEIRLFVFNAKGVYEYDAKGNILKKQADGDKRALIAGQQTFVLDAPVSLLMVIDFDKYGSKDERAIRMTCVDAGNVSENINLYCQAAGLATVPRATMDIDGIRLLLGFNENQLPIINNPVGKEKK